MAVYRWGEHLRHMRELTTNTGLIVASHGHLLELTLDRPSRLNAINGEVSNHLLAAVDAASSDNHIRVITITGTGARAFCAGADLRELAHEQGGLVRPMQGTVRNLFEAILDCPKPVVAVVNGLAYGAGCELAMACDLRLVSESATFAMPEAKVGMGGNFGAQMLGRLIPPGIAMEMLLLGDPITAQEALRLGLANRVVAQTKLREATDALVTNLLERAPLTQQHYKAAFAAGRDIPLSLALRLNIIPDPYSSLDRLEGVSAFNERRTPIWQGR